MVLCRSDDGGILEKKKKRVKVLDGSFVFFPHDDDLIFFRRSILTVILIQTPNMRISTKVYLLNFPYHPDYSLDQTIDMKVKL